MFTINSFLSLSKVSPLITHVSLCSHPAIAIQRITGNVDIAMCSCKQKAGGRCSHIAALLFLINALKNGLEPRMNVPVTSKQQVWGKGE